MKQAVDKFTADLFSSRRRGRPAKLAPKTNAQRQREFRQRRKFDFLISVTRNDKSDA